MYSNDNNYQPTGYGFNGNSQALTNTVSATMRKVYFRMTLALLVTAFTSLWCASSAAFMNYLIYHSWATWALIIAEFGLVIGISAGINKLSSPVATLLFYLFAIVNGMMLSSIFIVYSTTAIVKTFFITAGTFGAMSVYGYFTSKNLAKVGSFLFMALIGLIIASVVNIFVHSSGLDWIISIAGVLIFVGLTAWDTQQIKQMAMAAPAASIGRLATLGALSLYLDFINLFLYLLRIFGNRD
ncbi:MAG: Bax inhibitor-1/YccA family protein [Muribaculaceae bacterium]|nr:Bax inhibitor-1/YccA family protein [Muribaculaceae bacterium]